MLFRVFEIAKYRVDLEEVALIISKLKESSLIGDEWILCAWINLLGSRDESSLIPLRVSMILWLELGKYLNPVLTFSGVDVSNVMTAFTAF